MTARHGDSGDQTAVIVEDHRHLAGELRDLSETTNRAEIATIVNRLGTMLPAHFDREEAPEALRGAVSRSSPQLSGRLEAILGEHGALTELLTALKTSVDDGSVPDAAVVDLARRFLEQMRNHEARESALLTDALWGGRGG